MCFQVIEIKIDIYESILTYISSVHRGTGTTFLFCLFQRDVLMHEVDPLQSHISSQTSEASSSCYILIHLHLVHIHLVYM